METMTLEEYHTQILGEAPEVSVKAAQPDRSWLGNSVAGHHKESLYAALVIGFNWLNTQGRKRKNPAGEQHRRMADVVATYINRWNGGLICSKCYVLVPNEVATCPTCAAELLPFAEMK